MDMSNMDFSDGRKSPQEEYALVPYANKNPFDVEDNTSINPFSETSNNPFVNDGMNPFDDVDIGTNTNENKKAKKRGSKKNQTAAALLGFDDIEEEEEEERQIVPYGSNLEKRQDSMPLLLLDDKEFNSENQPNDNKDVKGNTSTALVVPNPFDDNHDILNNINNIDNNIVAVKNTDMNPFGDGYNDPIKMKNDTETKSFLIDDEDEMDEEDELSVSKPISRSEERARLTEMSELVEPRDQANQRAPSSATMEYDDVSEDDALFSSGLDDRESGDSFTSKNRRGSQGFFGKLLSSRASKFGNKDMYLGMDSYHGLNDFDEDTLATCRRKRTPNEERIFRVVGPYIWENRVSFTIALFFSILIIIGQSLSLKRLRIENSNIVEKLEGGGRFSPSFSPSVSPSFSPTVSPTVSPTSFFVNIKFKLNVTNSINETISQPSEMKINAEKKWLLPSSICSSKNPELNYTLIGCLDGNNQETNQLVIGASTSISNDGSIAVVGIQTQNNNTFIFDMSNEMYSSVSNPTLNYTNHTLDDSIIISGIGIVQIYQYQHLKNESKENNTFNVEDKRNTMQVGQWINNWEIKSNSDLNNGDNETEMDIDKDSFGYAVSLSGDGTRLAISSPTYKERRGRVQIYDFQPHPIKDNETNSFTVKSESENIPASVNETMEWVPRKNDISLGERIGDLEGYDIDLSNDGTHLAIGAVGYDCYTKANEEFGLDCGRVRVFEYSKETDEWMQKGTDIIGKVGGDRFGISVSLSEHGNRLSVGSWTVEKYASSTGSNPNIYLTTYEHNSTDWIEVTNTDMVDVFAGNLSSITNGNDETIQPSFSFSQNETIVAVSLGSLNKTQRNNEAVYWNGVFTQKNETKMWSDLRYEFKNEIIRNNTSSEETNIRKQNLAAISGDGKRVIFLIGSSIINDYSFDHEHKWNKMASIQRGDYFSGVSYPATLSLSFDGTRLMLVFVAINSTMQNVISLVYDIT